MIQLAELLLEQGGRVKTAAACYEADGSLDAGTAPPALRAADLGATMLLEVFTLHRDFRHDVIARCLAPLVGARDEAAAPYVRLLAQLVRRDQTAAGYRADFEPTLQVRVRA